MKKVFLIPIAGVATTFMFSSPAWATTWTTYTGTGVCSQPVAPNVFDSVPVKLTWVTEQTASGHTGGSVTISAPNGMDVEYGLWFTTVFDTSGARQEQGRFVGETPGGSPWYVDGTGAFAPDGWLGTTTGVTESVCHALGYAS